MSVLLFNLRGVPEDEANDIRALLAENNIPWYETPPGNWGISLPAIWLRDENLLPAAKALIDEYQKARYERVHGEYEQLKREGRHKTLWSVIRENPLRVLVYMAIIAMILYFSVKPFLDMGR